MILLWKDCPNPPHKFFSVLEVNVSFTTTSELTVHSNQTCRKEFQMGGSGHAWSSKFLMECVNLHDPPQPPSNMPAWYSLWLDRWQLGLKYSNSATELPSDSVVQLVRAWQGICQVMGSSPSLSHCHSLPSFFSSLSLTFLSQWLWPG